MRPTSRSCVTCSPGDAARRSTWFRWSSTRRSHSLAAMQALLGAAQDRARLLFFGGVAAPDLEPGFEVVLGPGAPPPPPHSRLRRASERPLRASRWSQVGTGVGPCSALTSCALEARLAGIDQEVLEPSDVGAEQALRDEPKVGIVEAEAEEHERPALVELVDDVGDPRRCDPAAQIRRRQSLEDGLLAPPPCRTAEAGSGRGGVPAPARRAPGSPARDSQRRC